MQDNQQTETITLTIRDCSGGVGLGLDEENKVDMLKPGMPAAKVFQIGDKVTFWNGIAMYEQREGKLEQRKLKDVVKPADSHTVVIERVCKQWETTAWETTSSWSSTNWAAGSNSWEAQ